MHAQVASLDPATHAYSFWEGVPVSSRRAFGALFRASKTLQVHPLAGTGAGVLPQLFMMRRSMVADGKQPASSKNACLDGWSCLLSVRP